MRILIVEDEASVAQRIERLTRQVLGNNAERIVSRSTLEAGLHYIQTHVIDVLLLDLNLNGKDGFDMLGNLVSYSFHTIIISANTHQAIEAFDYGVLDFIPKPFSIERLEKAFDRIQHDTHPRKMPARYLTVRKKGEVMVVKTDDILYIKASGNYSQLIMKNGPPQLHDKLLNTLETLLPDTFRRIHRSYICNWTGVERLLNHGAGKYEAELTNGEKLPVSRSRYQDLLKP